MKRFAYLAAFCLFAALAGCGGSGAADNDGGPDAAVDMKSMDAASALPEGGSDAAETGEGTEPAATP